MIDRRRMCLRAPTTGHPRKRGAAYYLQPFLTPPPGTFAMYLLTPWFRVASEGPARFIFLTSWLFRLLR